MTFFPLGMAAQLSLSQRIFKGTGRGVKSHISTSSARPASYKSWSQESLDAALAAIEVEGISVRRAALLHGIPHSTLQDHSSGRISRFAKPGPKPYLSVGEEEELVSFLVKCGQIGYPHTRQQVIAIVQQVVESKYDNPPLVTSGWWERFVQRHPSISLRTPAPLSFVRAMATDRECIGRYFDLLLTTLEENDLLNKATCIFNCDESGLPLSPKAEKVIIEVGSKNPFHLTGNTKDQITVLACSSAAGYALPPFVIFDRKNLNMKLTEGEVPGTVYGLSSNGWMTSELLAEWFKGHFLYYAPASRPLLLLLDGHKSHYCPDFIRLAAAEGIIVFVLPPNTTHISQPLDKGPFSPLKTHWKKVVQDFILKHRGRSVTRYDFSTLFADAWSKSMTIKNITAGFRTTGICPYNRNAIRFPDKQFAEFQPDALIKSTGLKFIPLYSPSRLSSINSTTSPLGSPDSTPCKGRVSLSSSSPSPDQSLRHSFSDPCLLDTSHTPQSSCYVPVKRGRLLSKFVSTPLPPSKLPTKGEKSCGKVLTSREQLKILAEKEEKKQEEERKKDERKKVREENKRLKEVKKKAKDEEKERVKGKKLKPKSRLRPRRGMLCISNMWCAHL